MTIRGSSKLMVDAELAGLVIEEHGDRFLARGGWVASLEGFDQSRAVVTEHPSFETAVEFYNSYAYQTAHANLGGDVDRDIFSSKRWIGVSAGS